jgi:hypothetical protein
MVVYLLESRSKPSFRKIYSSLFRELDRFAVPENHIGNSLNHVMLETVHRKELEYLKFYEKNVRQLAQAVDEKGYIDGGFVNFSVKRCKVLVLFRAKVGIEVVHDIGNLSICLCDFKK